MKIKVKKPDDSGILYVLYMWIDDVDDYVVKIGITKRPVTERVVEILTSFHSQYRYFPRLYIKRFRKVDNVMYKEKQMHEFFGGYSYSFCKAFGGHTEYFSGIEEEYLLDAYERCTKGQVLERKDETGSEESEEGREAERGTSDGARVVGTD